MVNFIWNLLFILLGQHVCGETTRAEYRRRVDLANTMFTDAHIHFTPNTTSLKCIENCFYMSNCVVVMSSGDGGDAECYLYDKQTVDMTNQVSSNTTHIFDRVSSVNVDCPIPSTTSTTPPTTTTTPVPTYLVYKSETLTWEGAKGVCQADGGDLAILDTPEEVQTVMDTMTGYYIWIGFNRSTPDGVNTWVDGRTVVGVTWKPGSPVTPGELCGSIAISATTYHKFEVCSRSDPFLCELPVA
ncbi:macrophage mannose receptor 1-like [Haliotis cracherodii]|uniref:macrophage mannose receptor 1-like n=1 Tax=Haliotis cracherodii TaxID=6455 RepID=UPI0039E85124